MERRKGDRIRMNERGGIFPFTLFFSFIILLIVTAAIEIYVNDLLFIGEIEAYYQLETMAAHAIKKIQLEEEIEGDQVTFKKGTFHYEDGYVLFEMEPTSKEAYTVTLLIENQLNHTMTKQLLYNKSERRMLER